MQLVGGFRVPLHYAAHENSTEICKMLVEAGASGTQRDFFGERPVSYAKPKSECHRVLLELEKKRSTDSLPGM
jgi:ankyrin repeat protein